MRQSWLRVVIRQAPMADQPTITEIMAQVGHRRDAEGALAADDAGAQAHGQGKEAEGFELWG